MLVMVAGPEMTDCQAGTVTRADGAGRACVGTVWADLRQEGALLAPSLNLLVSVPPMPDTAGHLSVTADLRAGRGGEQT